LRKKAKITPKQVHTAFIAAELMIITIIYTFQSTLISNNILLILD